MQRTLNIEEMVMRARQERLAARRAELARREIEDEEEGEEESLPPPDPAAYTHLFGCWA